MKKKEKERWKWDKRKEEEGEREGQKGEKSLLYSKFNLAGAESSLTEMVV